MKANDIKPGMCLICTDSPSSLAIFLVDKVNYQNEDFYGFSGEYIRLNDGSYHYVLMKVIDPNSLSAQIINSSFEISRTFFDEAKAKYDEYLDSISDLKRRIHTELQQ